MQPQLVNCIKAHACCMHEMGQLSDVPLFSACLPGVVLATHLQVGIYVINYNCSPVATRVLFVLV